MMSPMTAIPSFGDPSTLYRGGYVYSPADPTATALRVDAAGKVAWRGADSDAPAAERVVDLDGALVTPAFVDAHVHATDTGLALSGLDLAGTRSADDVLAAVAAHCASLPADAVVVGHGLPATGNWSGPRTAGWCTSRRPPSTRPSARPHCSPPRRRRLRRPGTTRRAGCAARRTMWSARSRSGR